MRNVVLEVNGTPYEGFTEINVKNSIEDFSGDFSFKATIEGIKFLPFKGNEPCRVLIDDIPLITGYIESVDYSYDTNSHEVEISGRDKTADIIDSSIVGNIELNSPSLETIVKAVLSGLNLDITIINQAGDIEPEKDELVSAEVGENAFDFIEKYARKRGVLLSTNGDGDIVFTRASTEVLDGVLVNKVNNDNNNVKSGAISYNFSNRYNKYTVKGQDNPLFLSLNDESTENIESQEGEAIDEDIRTSRILVLQPETESNNLSSAERAKWEANVRRARSIIYTSVTNDIFINKTQILEPNKLIPVVDDFCNIDSMMLIRSVNYNLSEAGTTVTVELVNKDSYTLQPTKDLNDSQYNKVGEDV